MNSVSALYWTSQAITTIQNYNLDHDIDPPLIEFYNNFGQKIGWQNVNRLFNSRDYQDLMNNKAY